MSAILPKNAITQCKPTTPEIGEHARYLHPRHLTFSLWTFLCLSSARRQPNTWSQSGHGKRCSGTDGGATSPLAVSVIKSSAAAGTAAEAAGGADVLTSVGGAAETPLPATAAGAGS